MTGLRNVVLIMMFMTIVIAHEHTQSHSSEASDSSENLPPHYEHNRWCRLANGTYLPYGYSFLHTACSLCQCLRSRSVRCQPLQCMPTYCFDNSMPVRREGQCCTQCRYEQQADTCSYNNMTYPHGTILKSIEDKMQCWCQLGNIECRNYMGNLMDTLMDSSAVFIIVIVLAIVLIFGCLLCCTCTLGFYYYYQRNQQIFQEAYEQYTTTTGWEPVEEGETVVDPVAEEKRLEAEKSNFDNRVVDAIPPPYTVHNSSYVAETEQK